MFDIIPRWASRMTIKGFRKTKHYQMPRMPWGLGQDEVGPLLRRWSPRVQEVKTQPYGFWRGPGAITLKLSTHVSFLRNLLPTIVHATTHKASVRPA